jgi:hypothetical protein
MNYLDLVFTTTVYWDVLKGNHSSFLGSMISPSSNMGHATMLHFWFCQKKIIKDTSYFIFVPFSIANIHHFVANDHGFFYGSKSYFEIFLNTMKNWLKYFML